MKNEENIYRKYCIGCGLCHSCNKTIFHKKNGFIFPENIDIELCRQICPAGGNYLNALSKDRPWGKYLTYECTWSKDATIRYNASSGGTLTSLCLYLLENGIVDGIIQTRMSNNSPIETETVISYSEQDVKKCMGSRYTASAPLINILQIVDKNKNYAFVGKPCDVLILRNYISLHSEWEQVFTIMMSFFCAGMPGKRANQKLLANLKTDEEHCTRLTYRGNGWPGFATAVLSNGNVNKMSYNDSWGGILGRDINQYCKFCMDGIGEFADIACGDAWYMRNDKLPDFNEHDGRNITFARTELGLELLQDAIKKGYLSKEDYNIQELKWIQAHQYSRKSKTYYRILAMKFCFQLVPIYSVKKLREFSKVISVKSRVKIILGTIKRVIEGKM